MLLFRVWQSRVRLKTTPGDGNKTEKVRMNEQEGGRRSRSGTDSPSRCQFALSGNSGAVR